MDNARTQSEKEDLADMRRPFADRYWEQADIPPVEAAEEDARRRGRFLWTPAAVQRSLVKLYAILRKDWEARCLQQKETAK